MSSRYDTQMPFASTLGLTSGSMTPYRTLVERTVAEIADAFAQPDLARQQGDAPAYRAYEADVPHEDLQLVFRTTIIEPGTVGDEYLMTKGHHHVVDSGEFYMGMAGEGLLVMETRSGTVEVEEMPVGRAVHVPPAWAHRSINVGDVPFVFLAVFLGHAGHDYASIERDGFSVRVLRDPDSTYRVVDRRR